MHKSKKKTAKLPKPIKVKKEKSEEDRLPQPMTHYIDDRLELVKQVFGTLKPKTIINLAPEFLKSQGLEEIEEACLNELLCISTKRLKSIIAASKCPSDTESSEDDEVQRHEEHVSLEEISSDSEIEGGVSKKGKKKKTFKAADKEKGGASNDAPKPSGDNPEISVLELLELQARARAIRSQLALEPVTKIEVDSDDNDKTEKTTKKNKKCNKTESSKSDRKRTSSVRESQDSSNANTKISEKDAEARKTKKIKIKRNYRNTSGQSREDDTEKEVVNRTNEDSNRKQDVKRRSQDEEKDKTQKRDAEKLTDKIKREIPSRSQSPDVIPIVAETETLLIDDSSDEGELKTLETPKTIQNTDEVETVQQVSLTEGSKERKQSEVEEGELNNSAEFLENPDANAVDASIDEPQTNIVEPPNETVMPKDDNSSSTSTSNIVTANPVVDEEDDEDHNDDVISLGEDLEDEMDEQLEKEVISKRSSFMSDDSYQETAQKSQKEQAIAVSSEEDHSTDNQSWHSRYMKSSKVSKVLAASRLGKRVRDKIKKSKDVPRVSSEIAEKEEPSFTSKHEDGSLDQYKELLELRQRKSK